MPRQIEIISEAELRKRVPLDLAALDAVERGFRALAEGRAIQPAILSMSLPRQNADIDVKTAYIEGLDAFAIKISPGFFDNPSIGLPTTQGLIAVLSARTGETRALLLDNGYLTDIRTAAAGAIAARHLAPEVDCAGVIGSGMQARYQMRAAHLVRPFRRALVWGRDPARAERAAADISQSLGIPVRATGDRAALLADCQLVITTTSAREPLIEAAWLHPGLHITAMGSDAEGKNELAPGVLAGADLYVADSLQQCAEFGELATAIRAGVMTPEGQAELGQIVIGQRPGRRSADQVTIADLTGTGVQDTAIADHALARMELKDKG